MAPPDQLTEAQQRAIVEEVVRRVSAALASPPPAEGAGAQTQAMRAMIDGGAARFGTQGSADGCATLAEMIDHTLLKNNATPQDIERLCTEARENHFASVCVNPTHVPLCAQLLRGSGVRVCTVVGFPLGATSTQAKAFETAQAVADGAEEIDMVINVGLLKGGDYPAVLRDIEAVVAAAQGRLTKVILETCELTDDEKIAGCVLAKAAGAHFVKTSTGFGKGGATPEDIALMRRIVGPRMGIKAAGGIRDCATAQEMVARGATRIGASASVAIVHGQQGKGY
jgi:deoxyribose-phosphate aldolase